jgi:hypothetical protein
MYEFSLWSCCSAHNTSIVDMMKDMILVKNKECGISASQFYISGIGIER